MNRPLAPWLFALAALSLGYAVHLGGGAPHPISFALLVLTLGAAGVGVAMMAGASRAPTTIERLLLFGLAAEFALMLVMPIGDYLIGVSPMDHAAYIITLAVAMAASLWLLRTEQPNWYLFGAIIALHFGLGVWVIAHSPDPFIDVWQFQQEGVDALLNGTNPYLPIYDDIYDGTSPYYGPGIVQDGRLTVGLPYPPLSLLMAIPGKLLAGDHRFAQLVALELGGVLMVLARPGRVAAAAALCLLFMPRTLLVVERGFTEPFAFLLLAFVAVAATRAPRILGVAVGLFVVVKQYLLLGLPLAVLLLARSTAPRWRLGLIAVVTGAAVTLPLALWDPSAFYNSTIRFHALQPFRPDSLTFATWLPSDAGELRSLIGFALLVPAGALVAWRAPRNPAGYMAGLAFMLLVFFAFGKQGAINYYFLVIGGLYLAVLLTDVSPWRIAHQ